VRPYILPSIAALRSSKCVFTNDLSTFPNSGDVQQGRSQHALHLDRSMTYL
jgi:hypothetical protein